MFVYVATLFLISPFDLEIMKKLSIRIIQRLLEKTTYSLSIIVIS